MEGRYLQNERIMYGVEFVIILYDFEGVDKEK